MQNARHTAPCKRPEQFQGADIVQSWYEQVQQAASSADDEALEQLPRTVLQPLANRYSQMVRSPGPISPHKKALLFHHALWQLISSPACCGRE